MKNNDINFLHYILTYCNKINTIINRLGNSLDIFLNTDDFHDLISFQILQIGELVNHLSDEFWAQTSHIMPWRNIVDMRNKFAHG
jgi:uncharacterized protein with HEPN domain